MGAARITALNIYPVKSCRGVGLSRAQLLSTGLAGDRGWLVVKPDGRFVTQRELPAMSLIDATVQGTTLRLAAPGSTGIEADAARGGERLRVKIWDDECWAFDAGPAAAQWLSRQLGRDLRLVSFDAATQRACDPDWIGEVPATTQFADGFPLLVISEASLEDLNKRLPRALPMNRFRPNIVLGGIDAYAEDRIHELRGAALGLRMVKPCARCVITTTEQSRGERDGDEPLRTLKSYRWDATLRGVTFGQNAIVTAGAGQWLEVGQQLDVDWA